MAFANVGQAGFKIGLDKSELDKGLPEAERQFKQTVDSMQSASQRPISIGTPQTRGVSVDALRDEVAGVRDLTKAEDDLIRVRSRRAQSLGPLRLAGIGLGAGTALFAATQLIGDLRDNLEATGAEALTTEGRLRNLGSAVLSGDIMGAVGAWTAEAETVDDLGITAQNAAPKLAALKDIAEGHSEAAKQAAAATQDLNDEQATSAEGFSRGALAAEAATEASQKYADVVAEAGTNSRELALAGIELIKQINAQRDAFNEAAGAAGTFTDALGNVMRLGPVIGPPQPAPLTPGSLFAGQPGVSTVAGPQAFGQRQNALADAQRRDALVEVQRLSAQNVQTAQYRYSVALQAASAPGLSAARRKFLTALVEKRNAELQSALDAEDAAEDAIRTKEKTERDKRLAKQKADATAAASAYREGLDTREQNLRNAYAAALQTPGMGDDKFRFEKLRDFLTGEGRDPQLTPGERAGYRSEFVTLKGQRKEDIKTADDAEKEEIRDRVKAQEKEFQNRVAAAELTKKNKKDDLRALRDLRDFYIGQARDRKQLWTEIEEADFAGDAITQRGKIQDVLKKKDDPVSSFDAGAFGRSMLAAQQQIWTGMMSQFLGGTGAGNALQTHALEQFTLQGNQERAEQTRHLRAISARSNSGGRVLDEAAFG